MFEQLRAEALVHIGAAGRCVLSTAGPAGLQAGLVPCAVQESCIYLLIPSASDMLFNLEHAGDVVLTTPEWQLHGVAMVHDPLAEWRRVLPAALCRQALGDSAVLAEVFPLRMHLEPHRGTYGTTVDFTLPPRATPAAHPAQKGGARY